ncbi:hypothetical protein SNE40_003330 [Patella caerulea]|uniref:Uncharacterized protein n=1 Tax=Patella caerulea TaxID=87958 RepID=A0AAN8Q0S0_PATCE
MEPGPIQKLLFSDEYSYMEDVVLIESVFVELNKIGDGIRIVSLGLTPDSLIMGTYKIISYQDDHTIIYDFNRDLSIEGLEIKWLVPLECINISQVPDEYILRISPIRCVPRHFELCNRVGYKVAWKKWLHRLGYLDEDPYGYVQRHSLRPSHSEELIQSKSEELIQSESKSKELIESKSKSKELIESKSQSKELLIQTKSQSKELIESKSKSKELIQSKSKSKELIESKSQSKELINRKSKELIQSKSRSKEMIQRKSKEMIRHESDKSIQGESEESPVEVHLEI